MRNIQKYYTKFRENLNVPKSRWGEKSGAKIRLEERNRLMQTIYQNLREEKPMVSQEKLIEKVIKEVSPKYGEVSHSRAERIIYTKN